MKTLKLIIIVLLVSSYTSSKHILEIQQKEVSKSNIPTDSNIEVTKNPVNKSIDTIIQIYHEAWNKKQTREVIQKDEHKHIVTKQSMGIHGIWDNLLKKHVSNEGNVDYKSFKKDHKSLIKYIGVLETAIPNKKSSKAYALAYWINAYNAFTIDLIIRNYPIKSIKEIKDPWGQRLWELGNKRYNLNEIEHEILRKMDEPRIHFAIVCASFSCPKLQNSAFTTKEIDNQLTNATIEFLSDSKRNNISENNLELSKIFQWFSKDFKQNGSLIDFLNLYTKVEISKKAQKNFKDYNWDLNE